MAGSLVNGPSTTAINGFTQSLSRWVVVFRKPIERLGLITLLVPLFVHYLCHAATIIMVNHFRKASISEMHDLSLPCGFTPRINNLYPSLISSPCLIIHVIVIAHCKTIIIQSFIGHKVSTTLMVRG